MTCRASTPVVGLTTPLPARCSSTHPASRITQQHGLSCRARPRPLRASRLTSSCSLSKPPRESSPPLLLLLLLDNACSCSHSSAPGALALARPRPRPRLRPHPWPSACGGGSAVGPACDPSSSSSSWSATPSLSLSLTMYHYHPIPSPPAQSKSKCGPQQPVGSPSSIRPLVATGQWLKFALQIAPARAA
jgi:hypothetical protein